MSRLQDALRLAEAGFRVLPSDRDTKKPALWKVGEEAEWKRWQDEDTAPRLRAWFKDRPSLELCAITGRSSGYVVLDIDSVLARDYWLELLGTEVLDQVPHSRSPKARELGDYIGHFFFSVADGQKVRNQGWHPKPDQPGHGFEWDIRGDGGIVKLPPSFGYNWVRAPWDVEGLPVPDTLVRAPDGAYPGRNAEKANKEASDGNVRSLFSHTVSTLGEGGRNNDVTRIFGHYAKAFRTRDMYDVQAELLWDRVEKETDGSYTREEFDKTRESIWEAERSKPTATLSESNGWLVGSGDEICVQTKTKTEDGFDIGVDHWGDFDVEALGVVTDANEERVYSLRLTPTGGEPVEVVLSTRDLADPRRLAAWLAQYGAGVMSPDNMWPRSGTAGERLRRYIEAQEPPSFKTVPYLGWHDPDGFITHEGRITADGFRDFLGVRPHPNLKLSRVAPYQYGFDDGWRDVLREVLTFHDEEVCSVYASWVVALLLRPQIRRFTSQFPFMAIQATSGSGKSTGFFSMMVQLIGNSGGQIAPTRAALRDYMSSHQSGIVWVDDLDDVGYLTELLRSATVEGTVTKKGEDRTSQVEARLVAGVVISGEELGMGTQKALLDRSIQLTAPDPKGRKSQKPGREDHRQWEDVIALQERCGWDLTRYAGSIVSEVLKHTDMVGQVQELTPGNGGRWADKIAVVRVGARILAELTEDASHVERVDRWAASQLDTGDENALTLQVLPAALAHTPRTASPMSVERSTAKSPVLVQGKTVWFSPKMLALWWSEHKRGQVENRVATEEVLIEQAKALGLGGVKGIDRKQVKVGGSEQRINYWRCPPDLSEVLIGRSEGEEPGGDDEGVIGGVTGRGDRTPKGQQSLQLASRGPIQEGANFPPETL